MATSEESHSSGFLNTALSVTSASKRTDDSVHFTSGSSELPSSTGEAVSADAGGGESLTTVPEYNMKGKNNDGSGELLTASWLGVDANPVERKQTPSTKRVIKAIGKDNRESLPAGSKGNRESLSASSGRPPRPSTPLSARSGHGSDRSRQSSQSKRSAENIRLPVPKIPKPSPTSRESLPTSH